MIAILTLTVFSSSTLRAQATDNTDILLQKILDALTRIETTLLTYIPQWITADASEQPMKSLSAYSQTLGNNISVQNGLDADGAGQKIQNQLLDDLFDGVDRSKFNTSGLSYTTLLKIPYATSSKNTDPAYVFVKNTAGLNFPHYPPWTYKFLTKTISDASTYAEYYNTIMSIQSFDAYVLSGFYVDYFINTTPLTKQQQALIEQANNTSWFTQVSSQYIGYVLRQILLYESQAFVVLTELLQTTKQLLAAQAMNNTLLILNSQANEKKLFQKAAGMPVTP